MRLVWTIVIIALGMAALLASNTLPPIVEGAYDLHLYGGVGATLILVAFSDMLLPIDHEPDDSFYRSIFWMVTVFLVTVELLQYFDPSRRVQLGDLIWQQVGIMAAILFSQATRPRKAAA